MFFLHTTICNEEFLCQAEFVIFRFFQDLCIKKSAIFAP